MQSPSSPLPAQDRLQAQPCLVDCSGKAYFSPVGGTWGRDFSLLPGGPIRRLSPLVEEDRRKDIPLGGRLKKLHFSPGDGCEDDCSPPWERQANTGLSPPWEELRNTRISPVGEEGR